MNGELGCRDTRGAMGRANEVTVIVLRKPDCGRHVDNGEAFRLVRPLFETNGLDVGDFANLANGFLFSIRPRTESWNGTERDAIMAGLSCLGSLGFSGYIAQKVLEDRGANRCLRGRPRGRRTCRGYGSRGRAASLPA